MPESKTPPSGLYFLAQVYVPLIGDITLHFSKASAIPSKSGSDSSKGVPESSPDFQTKHGPRIDQVKSKDIDSEDHESKVTVQGIVLGGCTLFPGSQVLLPNFF